jgi:hypothetical protein
LERDAVVEAGNCCIAPNALLLCNIVCIKSGQLSYSQIRNFRQRHLLPALSKRTASSPPRRPSKTNETHRTSSRGGFCFFRAVSKQINVVVHCRCEERKRMDAKTPPANKSEAARGNQSRLLCGGFRWRLCGFRRCARRQGFGRRDIIGVLGRQWPRGRCTWLRCAPGDDREGQGNQ